MTEPAPNRGYGVVIPVLNQARFVRTAIASAQAQTIPPVEMVVVDDGSTDGTKEVLGEFGRSIRVITQANRGVAYARNKGAANTTTEYIAFLDADDIWHPTKLEKQLARFDEPGVGLVHCALRHVDAGGRPLGALVNGLEGDVASEVLRFRRPVVLAAGSTLVIRRSAFEQCGGFDVRMSTSADFDLVYRLACANRVAFVNEILLDYRIHDSNMHKNVDAMSHDMRLAFEKAFSEPNYSRRFERKCYAQLHRVLAGSYVHSRRPVASLRHGIEAALLDPSQVATAVRGARSHLSGRFGTDQTGSSQVPLARRTTRPSD